MSDNTNVVNFNADQWVVQAVTYKFENYLGQDSLYLNNGIAYAKDSVFENGIIEYDIAFADESGYMGSAFRMQNESNFEEIYLRPKNSGSIYATQYEPCFNNVPAWQLFYGEGYNATADFSFNQWNHVKLVVLGHEANLYINDMDTPVLYVPELKRGIISGTVGLVVLGGGPEISFAPGYFSNFSYTNTENVTIKKTSEGKKIYHEGTVLSWSVSDAFNGEALNGKTQLTDQDMQERTWEKLDAERSGITNFAMLHPLLPEKNCVFSRITIDSEKDQMKQLKFGFSNRVHFYLNGKLQFWGNSTYKCRDYRFLGIMGRYEKIGNSDEMSYLYYYELCLDLKKGENELCMGVAESFGGWGVVAMFVDMDGISIAS
ncbi:MAG: hypothetical protein MI863_07830 [Desulfobacterales bacterium]|nr:hypothetical protein [Desulfobacterales bacterium]